MAGPVVVQVLVREVASGRGDGSRSGDVAIDQESHVIGVFSKRFQDKLAPGDHFPVVISGDVGRKQFRLAGVILGPAH